MTSNGTTTYKFAGSAYEAGRAIADAQHKDRTGSIPYRKEYNAITGSVEGSILLQQIHYWWKERESQAFYKYRGPCNAEKYKEGDSWLEELGFTDRQLDSALASVVVKITKGVSKNEARKWSLVISWTDSNRMTWYEMNETLYNTMVGLAYQNPDQLKKFNPSMYGSKERMSTFFENLNQNVLDNLQTVDCLDNPQTVDYIDNPQTVDYIPTETTTKTTTESPEKRLSAAPSSGGRGRSVPKTGYREEPERVAVGDENGNERNDARAQNGLERYILRQCQGNPQYLSPTNRRKLQEPIYVYKGKAQIEEPSPLLEWENDSEGFEEWVGKVANYVGGKGNRPTLAKLIQAIRNNYDAEGWGWLAVRANDLPVDDPSQPWNQ